MSLINAFFKQKIISIFIAIFFFSFYSSQWIYSQSIPKKEEKRIDKSTVTQQNLFSSHIKLLPLIGYKEYETIFSGGRVVLGRKNIYKGTIEQISSSLILGLKGSYAIGGQYLFVEPFPRPHVVSISVSFQDNLGSQFYGIGNETHFEQKLYQNEYYVIREKQFNAEVKGLFPIYYDYKNYISFGLALNWNSSNSYSSPLSASEKQEGLPYVNFYQEYRSQNSQMVCRYNELGLVGELNYRTLKDNGLRKKRKNLKMLEVDLSLSYFNSLNSLWEDHYRTHVVFHGKIGFSFSSSLRLIWNIGFEHMDGINIPFWLYPTLGGDYNAFFRHLYPFVPKKNGSLRGYAAKRFRGNSLWFQKIEVHSFLFSLSVVNNKMRIGNVLFFDVGRVFSPEDSSIGLFEELYHSYGGGVILHVPKYKATLILAVPYSKELSLTFQPSVRLDF